MTLFGHPVHPMLIPLPIGAFVFALAALAVHLATGDPFWLAGSYWLSIAGVVTGLAAAAAGLADWLGIPDDSPNKRIGLIHMVLNVCLVAVFFGAWLFLGGFGGVAPDAATGPALVMQIAAILALAVSGWLGGEMVYGKPAKQPEQAAQPGHAGPRPGPRRRITA